MIACAGSGGRIFTTRGSSASIRTGRPGEARARGSSAPIRAAAGKQEPRAPLLWYWARRSRSPGPQLLAPRADPETKEPGALVHQSGRETEEPGALVHQSGKAAPETEEPGALVHQSGRPPRRQRSQGLQFINPERPREEEPGAPVLRPGHGGAGAPGAPVLRSQRSRSRGLVLSLCVMPQGHVRGTANAIEVSEHVDC